MTYKLEDVTPRPWTFIGQENESFVFIIGDKYNPVLPAISKGLSQSIQNAQHIVHCVNNHETLVALVEELVQEGRILRNRCKRMMVDGSPRKNTQYTEFFLSPFDKLDNKATETLATIQEQGTCERLNKIKGE